MAETEERAVSPTVQALTKVGITAEDYVKGPSGKDAFMISIQPYENIGKIRLHEGNAKIDIFTDKEHRQAVLNVKERPRKFIRRVTYNDHYSKTKPTLEQAQSKLRSHFPVGLSNTGVIWTYKNVIIEDIKTNETRYNPITEQTEKTGERVHRLYKINGIVTASIRQRSRMTFLIGVDEKHHFICALPKQAESVEDAHKILRPAGVSVDAPRQGEWFFVPASQRLEGRLNRIATTEPKRLKNGGLEVMSSHIAMQMITVDKVKYVNGFIYDKRSARHTGIFLPSWHRVIRNNEITPRNPTERAERRSYD